jgi:hypothetical protein
MVSFKKQLLILYILVLFIYGIIYYIIGNNHFSNFNNKHWGVDCLFYSSTIISTCGNATMSPSTACSKIIVISQQIITIIIAGIFIINVN